MASPRTDSAPSLRVLAERFQLGQLVGEGAFAYVYRACDLTNGQELAVKLLKAEMRDNAEIIERFRREVFAVASLDSPHVVRLFDFAISGSEMFIAMEYIDGPTLRDVVGTRPLSPDAAHIVVGQVAQALAAAHAQGIVHRDLKPENVILARGARGRQVKVVDFGMAKLADFEQQLGLMTITKDGMCFGTPQYMSPEQIQGRSSATSSDLWALTVMAYEIVAGHLPWDGPTPRDVFYSIIGRPVPPIRAAHRSMKRLDEINHFFARALSQSAAARPADAETLFRDFEQALFGGPHAPAGKVFSGILSAEFAVTVDERASTEPGEGAIDPALLAETNRTQPGTARAHKRKLQPEWQPAIVEPLPQLSETAPGEAARLAPPPIAEPPPRSRDFDDEPTNEAAAAELPADAPTAAAPASEVAATTGSPAKDVAPTSAAAPSTSPVRASSNSSRAWLLILALAALAAALGYLFGHRVF